MFKLVQTAALMTVIGSASALAAGDPGTGGGGGRETGQTPSMEAVPGPVAGAGLPLLAVAGGALAWRIRRRRRSA
ncbi:hypothetical protein [Prosthecomicrobium sp. N25]|uniref:hypothetical protein n=1 Tax=Prosthecomicrobium sp. N25 TaxID=3129254 RepID=UPI00307867E9